MAEKKLAKRRRKNQTDGEDTTTLTKDEEEVAKYLRFNLPTKKSTLLGDEAHYFFGSKAVDFLMDSKWASGHKSSVAFTHRESVIAFLTKLLATRYFDHVHVIKIEKKVKKKDGDKKKEDDEKKDSTDKKKESEKKKNEKGKLEEKDDKKGSPRSKRDKDGKEVKKVKKKVKINLEPHEDQIFHDSEEEAYVWIFDPVSWKTFFFGVLLVLAIIAICLFPLWPENVREYSWYLSVAGAIFVGGILVLAVLRYVIYGILWICTMGKLHFWLLPNLTAECGFFESFVPAYEYSVIKSKKKEKTDTKKEKSVSVSDDQKNTNNEIKEKCNDNVSTENVDDVSKDKIESTEDIALDGKNDPNVEKVETENLEDEARCIEDESSNNTVDHKEDSPDDEGDKETISPEQDSPSRDKELVTNGITDEEIVKDISNAVLNIDKVEHDSEGSNDSVKEEEWVKVKKADVSITKSENAINC